VVRAIVHTWHDIILINTAFKLFARPSPVIVQRPVENYHGRGIQYPTRGSAF